jgi:FtsP/CotA-like multicopper oxidase with cupredoxin domain
MQKKEGKDMKLKNLLLLGLGLLSCQGKSEADLAQQDIKVSTGQTVDVNFDITKSRIDMDKNTSMAVWSYGTGTPGQAIVAQKGDRLRVHGKNLLDVETTIHWHGISPLSISQDGPFTPIASGQEFAFEFDLQESGTYWYHSHTRSVVEQVDRGLYAPLIVKGEDDSKYDGDHILMLDDFLVQEGVANEWLPGTGIGHMAMERVGNVIAVNGQIHQAIQPLVAQTGSIHKLRFIGAGTAAYFKVDLPHKMLMTHTDGHAVEKAYTTQSFIIGPGERFELEWPVQQSTNQPIKLTMVTSLSQPQSYNVETAIPVQVTGEEVTPLSRIFVDKPKTDVRRWLKQKPNYEFILASRMGKMNHNMSGQDHSMQNMNHSTSNATMPKKSMMEWTMNGQAFPHVPSIAIKKGEWVKIRFINNDMHRMDHPMHLHGASFQVLAINGKPYYNMDGGLLDKDVINVPSGGGVVDVLVKIDEVGDWMLHCHILDHEDNGMMTSISVSE